MQCMILSFCAYHRPSSWLTSTVNNNNKKCESNYNVVYHLRHIQGIVFNHHIQESSEEMTSLINWILQCVAIELWISIQLLQASKHSKHMCACLYSPATHTYTYTNSTHTHTHTHACTHTRMHAHTHLHACKHRHVHTHIQTKRINQFRVCV